MASQFSFGNKKISLPGSYSRIQAGIKNPPVGLDYGALLVIDTGSGAQWGGGSGVLGDIDKGKNSRYTFDNIQDFREFVSGGLWYDLAAPLFRPEQLGIPGVSTITFIRAAETTQASIALTFTGGGAAGGTITFKPKQEGLVANAVLSGDGSALYKGYAIKMTAGQIDSTAFILNFWKGTFRGNDSANDPIGGITQEQSRPILLVRSPEFKNIDELKAWADQDVELNRLFTITNFVKTGTGVIDSDDLANYVDFTPATGATETYSTAAMTAAIESVKEDFYDFILADRFGDDADHANNLQILAMIAEEMMIKPDMYIGGGIDSTKYTQSDGSIPNAQLYDSQYVTIVHSGIQEPKRNGTGMKILPSIYNAAYVLGREAGLPPQVPLTFKGIGIKGLAHQLNSREQELALQRGVLAVRFDNGSFDILKGVNTLQNNRFLLNEDSTTPSKQIRRIIRQINKELIVNSKIQLLKQPLGVNRNTLSEADLKNWVEGYLSSIVATPLADNLILSFQDVVVTRNQDAYFINYGVILNTEVSFLFFTGVVVEI